MKTQILSNGHEAERHHPNNKRLSRIFHVKAIGVRNVGIAQVRSCSRFVSLCLARYIYEEHPSIGTIKIDPNLSMEQGDVHGGILFGQSIH